MSSRLLGFVLVGAACVAAAGTGAYVATRHNASSVTATTDASPGAVADTNAPAAVAETEAQIAPVGQSATTEPAVPVPPPAQVARRETGRVPTQVGRTVNTPRQEAPVKVTETKPAAPTAPPARQDTPAIDNTAPAAAAVEPMPPLNVRYDPPAPPAPEPPAVPERRYEELVVPADAVIGLQIENSITSSTARIEDRVQAKVTRDVRTGGMVAIPAGSRVQGSVVVVERGGKFKERARLGVRFHTIVLTDGTAIPMHTETVFREGDSPTGQSAAKISGSAIGGAIIGAILGGGKGAIIGGATGAGAGTAAVAAGDRSEAKLSAGSSVTVRLAQPVSVSVER